MKRLLLSSFVSLLLVLLLPHAAAAQADVLTGRVVGPEGRPLAGARVEVLSVETEIVRSGLTDSNGRYMIIFPDGGGRYVLRISFLGMADIVEAVVREAGEELLLTNVTMAAQAIALDAITVRAQAPPPGQGQAGEQTTHLSQELLNRLPLPDLDPSTVALLSAGVVSTELDSLSGRLGFSVAGMSDLLNQVTLDGVLMGLGGLGVPEEGVRQTQITTSTFDASRGGFAGGLVAMTTSRGTNRAGGAFSYRLDDDALQLRSAATTNAFTRHNLGGSWGGPIVRNRLFYNASFQFARNVNHRFALAANDPAAAQRSGVTPDSIARFLSILESDFGVPTFGQTGAYNQTSEDVRFQGRVDWNLMQRRGQSHTLSARFNVNVNTQDSTRIRELDLAQRGGDTERDNRMAALTLNSRLRTNWTNALNLSFSESWNEALPFTEMPEGIVRVTSDFEDGTRDTRSLTFGGNRTMPSAAYGRDLQLANDLSLLVPVGHQLHRLKLGGSLQRTRDISRSTDNLFGSFTYASLEDFAANRPDRFERALTERETRTGRVNTGVYVGDTWRISQPLEITLGLRWDHARLDATPAYNPAVETTFGRRTDLVPQASGFSPRIGFSYRLNRPQQPSRSLTGGIGVFAGRAPSQLFAQAFRQTGLADADQRLICIGDAVPIPDWDAYMRDPLSVPTACAEGGEGVPPSLALRAPAVTLLGENQRLPSSLRVDLGYRTQLARFVTANTRYLYSRGFGLWGYRDLNLDESRSFTLGTEGRPYFGDPSGIVAATGAVSMATSRRSADFGNVFEVTSDRRSAAHQLSTQLMGMLSQRTTVMANYTLGFARDQGSAGGGGFGGFGGGGVAITTPTAGSPNDVEWAVSSTDRRHTLNLVVSHAFRPTFELSAMGRVSSGAPFTPIVNRDINGDGLRNDRAFVFDPASPVDAEVATAMTRLLAASPGRVRDCLEAQFGRIADRNSCRNGWTQSLDLRAGIRPNLPRLERRFTVSVDARNVLTGVDQLLHGRDGMKGWGEGRMADPTLLYVRGFDPATRSFSYEINEGFGQTRRGSNAFRNPFALTISARVTLGGQPQIANRGFGSFGGMVAMGMGGFGGGAGGGRGGMGGFGGRGGFDPAMLAGMREAFGMFMGGGDVDAAALLGTAIANPLPRVLALRDSIGMSAAQAARIEALSDTLDAQLAQRRAALEPVVESLRQAVQGGRGAPQPQQLMQRVQSEVQPQLDGAQREVMAALRLAERELGEEQWNRLPAELRAQPQAGRAALAGMGGMGGPGGFNAIGVLDRMLANPVPVLLELKDTLGLTAEQVVRIETISSELQARLDRRREELGRRFDNAQGAQQGRIFAELQPEIERTRREVMDALRAVERVLTREQWQQVPERIRNPFARGPGEGMMQRRGGG
jgi:hypothetical protein